MASPPSSSSGPPSTCLSAWEVLLAACANDHQAVRTAVHTAYEALVRKQRGIRTPLQRLTEEEGKGIATAILGTTRGLIRRNADALLTLALLRLRQRQEGKCLTCLRETKIVEGEVKLPKISCL